MSFQRRSIDTLPLANEVRQRFARCKEEGRAALVVYLTHGDPSCDGSLEMLEAVSEAGADVIELGVPFSDPAADGPVIQEAMLRALAAGSSIKAALRTVAQFRERGHKTPLVLFGYFNPLLQYGIENFAKDASCAGVNAVLCVDVPMEELAELSEPLAAHGVGIVPLLAPTSTEDRIDRVADFEPAFVYYVSKTGVTGSSFQGAAGGEERVALIQQKSQAPVAVGFGIKTPGDAAKVAQIADGVVVGSALVQRIAENAGAEREQEVRSFVRSLAESLGR